jgi:hypothetical protein
MVRQDRHCSRPREGGLGRRLRVVLLACAALPIGLLGALPLGDTFADTSPMTLLGRMSWGGMPPSVDEHSFDATLLVDPSTNRGFLTPSISTVRVFDLQSRTFKELSPPAGVSGSGVDGNARDVIDTVHHRVFYPERQYLAPSCALANGHIDVLSTQTLAWTKISAPCAPSGDILHPLGMSYSAAANKLYVVGHDEADQYTFTVANLPGIATFYLAQVDAETGATDWVVPVPRAICTTVTNYFPYGPVMVGRYKNTVALVCAHASAGSSWENFVVEVSLDSSGAVVMTGALPQYTITPTLGGIISPSFDAEAGKILVNFTLTGPALGSYVFDLSTHLFTGVISTGAEKVEDNLTGIGFDDTFGRVYLRNKVGLIAADIRHRPLPAGLVYSDLKDTVNNSTIRHSAQVIGVDSQRHIIYMPDYSSGGFLVYQDNVPATPDLAAPNPDQNTMNIPEVAGQTAATYSGTGNSFGTFLLSTGGPKQFINNTDPLCLPDPNPETGQPQPLSERDYLGHCVGDGVGPSGVGGADSAPQPGDRLWYFGHVRSATLTNEGANGDSAPVDLTDPATKKDLGNLGATPYLQGKGIIDHATCQDFGAGAKKGSADSGATSAAVSCDVGNASVSGWGADGGGSSGTALLPLMVSSASSSVTITKSQVHATALARGVQIPAGQVILSIGEISTDAVTNAHGRAGTASATFTRTISSFVSPSYTCAAICDPEQVVSAINTVFQQAQIAAVAVLPQPDGDTCLEKGTSACLSGTPLGYQAVVSKDAGLRTSEFTVNDDPTDTVAGLEIVYFNDGVNGTSRQIAQFAGVHAESHYGVFLLNQGGDNGGGGTDDGGATPPVTTSGGVTGGSGPATLGPSTTPPPTNPPAVANPLQEIISGLTQLIERGWRLIVSDPAHAGLLAAMWLLLLSPLYLALRRRALVMRMKGAA